MILDHNRGIFDSFKRQAEGVFDALLTKSQSIWSAIGNSLKTALLTAIKDVVTSRVAAMLMQMFTGTSVSLRPATSGGAGMLGGLGGMLGIGAAPVFGGSAGVAGTPPFLPATVSVFNPAAQASAGALASRGVGGLAGLKEFLGFGGGVQYAPGAATTWQAASMSQKLSALGRSNAALLGGGLLAMDGLRRGGWTGLAETTAGGALIGFKYGGPLGAAIGAAAGAAAGFVRLFMKGSDQKAIDKIRDIYKVTVDKGFARSVVEMVKSSFGGNLEAAVRSAQVRDMVFEYAMATGQNAGLADNKPRGVWMTQQGGVLSQSGFTLNGQQYGYVSNLPGLGGLRTPQQQQQQQVIHVTIQADGESTERFLEGKTVKFVRNNEGAVTSSFNAGISKSLGRTAALTALSDPMAVKI